MNLQTKLRRVLLLAVLALSACNTATPVIEPTPVLPTATLRQPNVQVTRAPDAGTAAQSFMDAWKAEDYAAMYALLTPAAQSAITQEDFEKRYRDTAMNMTLDTIEFTLQHGTQTPASAEVKSQVVYHTNLMGDLVRDFTLPLVMEQGQWRLQWDDGLVFPELKGGNQMVMELSVPERGIIYDRYGDALAMNADAVAIGFQPGLVPEGRENELFTILSQLTGKTTAWLKDQYDAAAPSWYIAVGEALASSVEGRIEALNNLGAFVSPFSGRYYPYQGIGPHVVGYVQPIYAENLEAYRRLGYRQDEWVGQLGLEEWGDKYLTGTRGASLLIKDPQGQIVTRLGQVQESPAQDIYTTLEYNLQLMAQRAVQDFPGAVVVIERDTGRVLAMASSPTFDPNGFNPNRNSEVILQKAFDPAEQRLVNRAAQGSGYPLGSVFKIIDLAAALENGMFTADSTYDCQYTFRELEGVTYYDWTYEKEKPASGLLTLPEGLMRSCNPWFYHIGLEMFRAGSGQDISNMARAFGFGSPSGLEPLDEIAGNVPDPSNDAQAVELAIGQDRLLVTPLQVARFIAAIGNGGTLFQPQLIETIEAPDSTPLFTFQPVKAGKLPVSPENLQIIQDAMRSVVANRRGTAYDVFTGMSIPIFGKTGTAQTGSGLPSHAWFAGYTNAGRANLPDIAIAVIAENSGEGSEIAAPIFRRIVETYFFGRPQKLYPWESSLYVKRTPKPEETEAPPVEETPIPSETPTPEGFIPEETPTP